MSTPRRPSLVDFNVYDGRIKHSEGVLTARVEERRTQQRVGPGSYNPVILEKRTPTPLITPPSSLNPSRCATPPHLRRHAPPLEEHPPEFVRRLTSAHTQTYRINLRARLAEEPRESLPTPWMPTSLSRSASVSSPRKRPSEGAKRMDAGQMRRTVERLHGEKTSASVAAQKVTDRSGELQWGAERWGVGGAAGRAVLFPPPVW